MNEKFTPGEWGWFISDNGDGFPIIYFGDTDIAEVYLPNGNSEQMLSNAHLIAAAPEMYHELSRECTICRLKDHETECDFCRIGKVLKKARGEK